MKFSNLVLASSISVVVSISSSKLRTNGGVGRGLQLVESDAATCGLTMDDLDLQTFASIENCVGKPVLMRVKEKMAAKGCSTLGQDVSKEAMALTGQPNTRKAKKSLVKTCQSYIDYGDSCTSIESLNFRTIGKCENAGILNRVKEVMAETECPHDLNKELELLTGFTDTDAARSSLQASCKGVFGCTTNFEVNGCDYRTVIGALERKVKNCPHDSETELQKMTGTSTIDDAKEYLSEVCDNAFDDVDTYTSTDIDSRFTKNFMNKFALGGTFLNTETGNFQGGDNPDHPTSEASRTAGESINEFYEDGANDSILLNNGWGDFDKCENQAYMCCFGRDRQSNDNNGNCADDDCDDADPGDNSNLCYTQPSNTPYFGEIEDDIHCHGLAWAEDDNDLISRFKMNNFFYVSMYDHLYQRGYVEPAVTGGPDDIKMCGCIESMPKVSRADCTQVDVDLTFSFFRGENGFVEAVTDADAQVDFNSCRGTDFDDGNNANNDLASYAVKLVDQGRMTVATREKIFGTLLGYADPGDNDNEDVCVDAYEKLTGNTHPCTNIDGTEINGCDFNTLHEALVESIRDDCLHGIEEELQLLTGTTTYDGAVAAINNMCSDAWDQVIKTDFKTISNTFGDRFMKNYIKGDTFLNLETGNFQGDTEGSTPETIQAGEEIAAFYEEGSQHTRMVANFPSDATSFENCALNSIMCCFGRDRQFGDNNGNCNRNDCDDADPADNSNLCYTEPSNTPFPQDKEGDVHCHGLAWADDENDFSARLKYNNFFYVSLYDHMYTRGYVQEMTFDQDIPDTVPMCGCVEDMQPVSRSDCTELEVEQTFQFSIDVTGSLIAKPKGDMEIDFNACKGINPGNPTKRANNDLASYVYRLAEEGKMTEDAKAAIYQKLVGYEKPGSNNNENACKASYEDETGEEYPRN